MKNIPLLLILAGFGVAHAADPGSQMESCEQIREQIKAHTGTPAKPNTTLLGKVGANKKCRFTSVEAYRAAWGDKPMPKDERRQKHGHDD